MKTCQVHPLSITIGAIAAALLLFACSSGGGGGSGGRSVPSPGPYQSPAANSLVSFYSDNSVPNGPGTSLHDFGTVDETVITDIHWTGNNNGRLLVNGATVFGWSYATPSTGAASRFTLAHGIRIPAGASLAVENGGNFVSLAGYKP
jgi:hypothetical protein